MLICLSGRTRLRPDKSAQLGILAFGSLIRDPGSEISALIVRNIDVKTPFAVEFAKYSHGTRAGAPTIYPVSRGGARVNAKVLVLQKGTSSEVATDMLWRRETGNVGSRKKYPAARTPRAVRVRMLMNFAGVAKVLYTDFYHRGKIRRPSPVPLARRAISSVSEAAKNKDGISYLMGVIEAGISTPLTNDYGNEILRITGTTSLASALRAIQRDPSVT